MKNKGVTLIEILVVVIIMGILAGIFTANISNSRYADSKVCTDNIEKYLNDLRIRTMSSKTQPYLIIYQASNNNYYITIKQDYTVNYTKEQGEKIANSNVSIIGTKASLEQKVDFASGKRVILAIQRETGAFKAVDGDIYDGIRVKNGNKSYKISLIKKTGRHTTKKE